MTTGWNRLKLREICDFKNGLWTGKKEPYVRVGVIRNTNFTKEGFLDNSDIAYLDVEVKLYATRKLEAGDIILEKSGGGPKQPVGRVVYFDKMKGEFSFSNFTSVIRVREKSKIDPAYLHRLLHFYYMSGLTEPMQKYSTGIRNLQLKEYQELIIPFPSIQEQKYIVDILDEAFAGIDQAIANTEKNLASTRELFERFVHGLLVTNNTNWSVKKIGDVCNLYQGLAINQGTKHLLVENSSLPLLRIKDLRNNS